MPDTVIEILALILRFAFGIVILFFMLRFVLGLVRANPGNPLSQTILQFTNPVLRPLRSIVPSFGRFDTAAVVIGIVLKTLELVLLAQLFGASVGIGTLIAVAILMLLTLIVWIFLISIIIEVVMSWFQAAGSGPNPIGHLVADINRPLLGPLRRMLPPTGMIDFSPMIAILGLYILLTILHAMR